jgi:LacI family transcriptional regulator
MEVANRLDRLICRQPPASTALIPPKGVTSRESTALKPLTDDRVARVMTFIHDHPHEDFAVAALVQVARTSRRTLELAFTRTVGCTLYQYMRQVRVDQAKKMLSRNAQMKIREVSMRCGFASVRQMERVFQRLAGVTPAAYKRLATTPSTFERPKQRPA